MPNMNSNPNYYRPPSEWRQPPSSGFDVPNLPWAESQYKDTGDFWGGLLRGVPKGMEDYSATNMIPRMGNEIWGAAQGAGRWAQNLWDQWRGPQTDAISQASPQEKQTPDFNAILAYMRQMGIQ